MTSECRFCGEEITWQKHDDDSREKGYRWVPTNPETQDQHRCQRTYDDKKEEGEEGITQQFQGVVIAMHR